MSARVEVGEVLSRTFKVYGEQAGVLIPAALLVFAPVAIVDGLVRGSGQSLPLLLLSTAISLIASFWFQGVVVKAIDDIRDGRRDVDIRELFEAAAPFVPALIGAGVLAGLGIALGLILLIVPGLVLATIWSMIAPVIVMERTGAMAAFGRSRKLVRGNGWPVFGVIVVIFVISLIASFLLGALLLGIASNAVAYGLATLLSSGLVAPVSAIAVTVMYFELLGPQVPSAPATPAA